MTYHITARGVAIKLRDLDDQHLINIINYNKERGRPIAKYIKEKNRRLKYSKLRTSSLLLNVVIL